MGPLNRTWRRGRITAWIRPGTRPGWECQIVPDGDTPPDDLLRVGQYVYDPAFIRPRYRGEAAPVGQDEGRPCER